MKIFFEAIYVANLKMGAVALPLFLVGLVGWLYILGLFFYFRNHLKKVNISTDEFRNAIDKEEFPSLKTSLFNSYAHLLFHHRKHNFYHTKAIIENVYSKFYTEISQRLFSVKVMAGVAPLLGLLGTVNGIVKTFEIITREGSTNVIMLSEGISEALLTTQAGLVISVPLLFMHNLVQGYFKKVLERFDEYEAIVSQKFETKN